MGQKTGSKGACAVTAKTLESFAVTELSLGELRTREARFKREGDELYSELKRLRELHNVALSQFEIVSGAYEIAKAKRQLMEMTNAEHDCR
jgi:hypothetical protein